MKEIKLTQGKVALVDDEDFEWLNQWKWCVTKCKKGYYVVRGISINGIKSNILMHRIIMNTPKRKEVDHKDHDGLNCQKHNMRNCTHKQNCMNAPPRGKSKYLGVCYDGRYIKASIKINGKVKHLGHFKTEELAAKKYNEFAGKYFGEFSNLNIIN
jgi:hypothetical protein